jgi:hypothetical protein
MTGEATLNVLNLKDFTGNSNHSMGLLELHLGGDNGFGMSLGSGGTDVSLGTLAGAMAGVRDSSKIIDAKLSALDGNIEDISTLNAINMMGWTGNGLNQKTAKAIWEDELQVTYRDIGTDYGKYEIGSDGVTISKALLGGGKEGSAKLATVMAHEGIHVGGTRIERIAHIQGNSTYNTINAMFGLTGDAEFTGKIISAILDPDSWKENTGNVDKWDIEVSKGKIYADWNETQYITLPDGSVIKVKNNTGKVSAGKLTSTLFNGTDVSLEMEALFYQAGITWNGSEWVTESGDPIDANTRLRVDITDLVANSKTYQKDFDAWLRGGMDGAVINDIGGLPDGLFGYVNRTRLLGNLEYYTSVMEGTPAEKIQQLREVVGNSNAYAWAGEAFFNQASALYWAFLGHIGGSIMPDAREAKSEDDFGKNNTIKYDSMRNGESVHTGADIKAEKGIDVYAGFGGRISQLSPAQNPLQFSVTYSDTKSVLTYETGFMFGDRFVSTGLWIQDRHMDIPSVPDYTVFGSDKKLGTVSNVWSSGSIRPHLHMDIVTQTSNNDSKWFQNIFQPSSASDIIWKTESGAFTDALNRTYWNAKDVWDKYWKTAK